MENTRLLLKQMEKYLNEHELYLDRFFEEHVLDPYSLQTEGDDERKMELAKEFLKFFGDSYSMSRCLEQSSWAGNIPLVEHLLDTEEFTQDELSEALSESRTKHMVRAIVLKLREKYDKKIVQAILKGVESPKPEVNAMLKKARKFVDRME